MKTRKDQQKEHPATPEENKRTVRRIDDELWNGRKLEVADERSGGERRKVKPGKK